MKITNNEICELRKKTGAGMMDCKKALEESDGNIDQAMVCLRKKGLADIKEREHKSANEGGIGCYVHAGDKIGVLVEINCETDFVAKSDAFKQFRKDLAMHIAATNPQWISRQEVPQLVIDRELQIIEPQIKGKPENIAEKIISGKLSKVFKETCLMEQEFIKDPNLTITDLLGELAAKVGEKIVIKRFVRYIVGE